MKTHFYQPHRRNGRYYNCADEREHAVLFPSIAIYMMRLLFGKSAGYNPYWAGKGTISAPVLQGVELMWIGHSTFLIRTPTLTILTDPIFGDASLLFPRIIPPALEVHELPHVDIVLISHNHRDHLDAGSIHKLITRNPEVQFLVPDGDARWFFRRGIRNVIECSWWDRPRSGFTFVPAKHWSQRGIFDRNRSLWGGWMLELEGKTIFFAGDTAYGDHFHAIAQQFPFIDMALLPIGPGQPRDIMAHAHLDATQAIVAGQELNASAVIPMHWGTFHLGLELPQNQLEQLQRSWRENQMSLSQLLIPRCGESVLVGSPSAVPLELPQVEKRTIALP